jgi:Fe-S cluster biosynthesis and repair protein YggX
MARMVNCVYLKKEAEGLDFPTYPGDLGKRIYDSVSKEAWAAWLRHQTMLVNENRLNLADARARQYLSRQMESFFFGEGADKPAGYVPRRPEPPNSRTRPNPTDPDPQRPPGSLRRAAQDALDQDPRVEFNANHSH